MLDSFQKKRILVLGASSWLGYLLVNKLADKKCSVAGTVFKSNVTFQDNIEIFRTDNSIEGHKEIIASFQPTVIVNFLRGEDEQGFQLHKFIIEKSESDAIHYIYASSVLALDGYTNINLTEGLEAKGVSPYGIFKANCEKELVASTCIYTILRFASVQGWVPHKATRNQQLLEKLANQKTIQVDRGVVQNRILATVLIEGIVDIIQDQVTGIIHFGSEDASEEHAFLRKQAKLFGFEPTLIESGKQRTINLVAIPEKLYELYGNKYRITEKQTLEGLLNIKALVDYKN